MVILLDSQKPKTNSITIINYDSGREYAMSEVKRIRDKG